MALEIQSRVVDLVRSILGAGLAKTPDWLIRPGKKECGSEWSRVSKIYAELTGQVLPDVMRPIERRSVDAVLTVKALPPRILEVDEKQHFNEYRARTLRHYGDVHLAFDIQAFLAASMAKSKLEGGGFARPMPPLFPGTNGRHQQRAFRDALCDLLPPLYGFAPTLRIADFEVKAWLFKADAKDHMTTLLATRLG